MNVGRHVQNELQERVSSSAQSILNRKLLFIRTYQSLNVGEGRVAEDIIIPNQPINHRSDGVEDLLLDPPPGTRRSCHRIKQQRRWIAALDELLLVYDREQGCDMGKVGIDQCRDESGGEDRFLRLVRAFRW